MDDVLRYKGTRALVTGAASGMGAATASILAELGAEVHGLDIQEGDASLEHFHLCDLSDPAAVDAVVDAVGELHFGNSSSHRRRITRCALSAL